MVTLGFCVISDTQIEHASSGVVDAGGVGCEQRSRVRRAGRLFIAALASMTYCTTTLSAPTTPAAFRLTSSAVAWSGTRPCKVHLAALNSAQRTGSAGSISATVVVEGTVEAGLVVAGAVVAGAVVEAAVATAAVVGGVATAAVVGAATVVATLWPVLPLPLLTSPAMPATRAPRRRWPLRSGPSLAAASSAPVGGSAGRRWRSVARLGSPRRRRHP